ncbi:hypothetical protein IFM89_023056 [Coptis chinensis]|uniref:Peroxisomal membrane protein PEX14 n=1 Tax=Coptis chinensis TaxID=261450 RepID=A0A835IXU5_9MAGN|nr:hypothetical protein IFM89_023056 [Coptis chinensis]
MGSESTPPDEKAPEPVKPMAEERQTLPGDITRESSPSSVFVNSEPIREDQVQNAVKFLSHPKVRGSPVMYRRSFLEKKGLSKEEIDEAFRRVPDPAPTVTATQATNQSQDGQVKSATNLQSQVSAHTPQPVVAAPAECDIIFIVQNAILPRLKSWIRKVVLEEETDSMKKLDSKPSLVEEAAEAAKAAAAAATVVAKASEELVNSKHEERRYFDSLRNLLDVQVEEMKSMSKAIRQLEVTKEVATSSIKQTEVKSASNVTTLSTPASVLPSVAPHSKSYMEIMAMIQRGETPPGIKDINDLPPNPNQAPSNPRLAPRIKPWEVSQGQNGSHHIEGSNSNAQDYIPSSHVNGNGSDTWWQRKNVRITELEPENELRVNSYPPPSGNERLNQRAWVPPQPPPIAMPEAAAAIRQPKTSIQSEQSNGNHLIAHPSDDFDELQRITKISESGGEVEISEVSTVQNLSEIQQV